MPDSAARHNEVYESYMLKGGGDTEVALDLATKDLLLMADDQALLEHDVATRDARIKRLEADLEVVEPDFLEKLGNSTVFKIGLVVLGMKLGVEASR